MPAFGSVACLGEGKAERERCWVWARLKRYETKPYRNSGAVGASVHWPAAVRSSDGPGTPQGRNETRRIEMTADQGPHQPAPATSAGGTPEPLYGGRAARRLTVRDVAAAKARGEKWPMLTAYDALTASVFDAV